MVANNRNLWNHLSLRRILPKRKPLALAVLGFIASLLILIPSMMGQPLAPFASKRPDPIEKKSEPPIIRQDRKTVADRLGGLMPLGLPPWFKELDADEEGQVSFHQWRAGGRTLEEFRTYDLNHDGYITADEVLRYLRKPIELNAKRGPVSYKGVMEESDESYGKKQHAKFFLIRLEKGKTYQFDLSSTKFDSYLYLEDPDGEILLEDDDSGGNLDARIVFRASQTGVYRLVATGLGKFDGGPFTFSVRITSNYTLDLPKGLPAWFKDLDLNEDGQVSFFEWRSADKPANEFHKFDSNSDGFITPEEVFAYMNKPLDPRVSNGLVTLHDTVEEPEESYRNRKAYKIVTIHLEKGASYQIDLVSQVYYAYVILENAEGELLAKHNSGGRGKTAQIVFHAPQTAIYRLVLTSQDGVKTGGFSLTVRMLRRSAVVVPKGLPAWFRDLDIDGDGQVALYEWRAAGKNLDHFRRYDLNDDGYITVEEMERFMKNPIELAAEESQASFEYALESTEDNVYRGKKAYKILTIKLEEGVTYQIDCQSKSFQSFLYLEDAGGDVLAEKSAANIGGNSQIVFRAPRAGTYRIVATSLGGFRTGDFLLSIRVKN